MSVCVRVWVMYVCVNVHFCTFAHVALCACFNLCAAYEIICVCMCICVHARERERGDSGIHIYAICCTLELYCAAVALLDI